MSSDELAIELIRISSNIQDKQDRYIMLASAMLLMTSVKDEEFDDSI